MAQNPQVAVDAGLEPGAIGWRGFAGIGQAVVAFHRGGEVAFGAVGDDYTPRFDDGAEILYAPVCRLQMDLAGVEGEAQFPSEIVADLGDQGGKELPVLVDDHQVIHVTAVRAYPEGVFDEVVQRVEVKVGEYLTGEISNGETTAPSAR